MTIAMCYVSLEGIVIGADSTTSFSYSDGPHFYNHNQKLFEVGINSTLSIVTWGLGTFFNTSLRTLVAKLSDSLSLAPAASVLEVVTRWSSQFWMAYTTSPELASAIATLTLLNAKLAHDPAIAAPTHRTSDEEKQLTNLRHNMRIGFCIAGYVLPDRHPSAYELTVDPLSGPAAPTPIAFGSYSFWGVPNMAERLIYGYDVEIRKSVTNSPHWTGTQADYDTLMAPHKLHHDAIPIRDAVDFVHTCIHSTIKALKFSRFSQVCGGPIEIAVITTDRPLRWVRHKDWDAGIMEGQSL